MAVGALIGGAILLIEPIGIEMWYKTSRLAPSGLLIEPIGIEMSKRLTQFFRAIQLLIEPIGIEI